MEGTTIDFSLEVEFQQCAKEVQETSEAYQRALGKFHYLQTLAQRLNPPPNQENELVN